MLECVSFILYIFIACFFTKAAIEVSYEETKRISFLCAALWWFIAILEVLKFVV
jgi:hypothetical protein